MSKNTKSVEEMSVYDWFRFGEVGLSSEALMRFLFKLPDTARPHIGRDFPYDPADLRRCRLALEATGTTDRIKEAAAISPTWAALVAVWDDLCNTMDSEVPEWRKGGRGNCPNTYNKMMAARDSAKGAVNV